jgi:hypothetical protein
VTRSDVAMASAVADTVGSGKQLKVQVFSAIESEKAETDPVLLRRYNLT